MEPMNCAVHADSDGCEVWVDSEARTAKGDERVRLWERHWSSSRHTLITN